MVIHHVEATEAWADEILHTKVFGPLDCILRSRGCSLVRTTLLRNAVARAASAAFYNRAPHESYSAWVGEHATNSMVSFILHNRMRMRQHNRTVHMAMADLQQAMHVLAEFDAIGRTEELNLFMKHVDVLLGGVANASTDVPPSEGQSLTHANLTPASQKYELTMEEREWTANRTILDGMLVDSICERQMPKGKVCPLQELRGKVATRAHLPLCTAGLEGGR